MLVDTIWDVTLVSSVILNTFVLNKIFLNEVSANLNTTYGDPLDVIGMTFIPLLYRWTVDSSPVIVAGLGELYDIHMYLE